jgi:hypothetical protein
VGSTSTLQAAAKRVNALAALWEHSPQPGTQTVRLNVQLVDTQIVQPLRVMTATLGSTSMWPEAMKRMIALAVLWEHSPRPGTQIVRPNVQLANIQTLKPLRVTTATLESTERLAQQPVLAPVTVPLVAFRQPVISLVRLRTTALRVTLEGTERLAQQPVRAPVTVLLVAFRHLVISLVLLQMIAVRVLLEGMEPLVAS